MRVVGDIGRHNTEGDTIPHRVVVRFPSCQYGYATAKSTGKETFACLSKAQSWSSILHPPPHD